MAEQDNRFIQQVREQLKELEQKHRAMASEITGLETQISSLQLYLGTATGTMEPQPTRAPLGRMFALHGAKMPKRVHRATGPRGVKMTTIIAILKDVASNGLNLDQIIEHAAIRGVELLRPSLRSQLSKANTNGYVVNRRGVYYHPSALKDLEDRTGASADTDAPEAGG